MLKDAGKYLDNDAIVGTPTLTQDWTFDQLGNWNGFVQGQVDALNQTRTHSKTNEISTISKTVGIEWADPVRDDNGNMTTMP